MNFKNLFMVPEGQKITEKQLHRILAASICSILLCMTCLAGTTWAWFIVEIENPGNIIQIGNPEIHVTVRKTPMENGTQSTESGEVEFEPGGTLEAGDYTLHLTHAGAPDDLQQKSTLYVTMIIQYGTGSTITVYTTLDSGNGYETTVNLNARSECQISWEVTWFAPVNAVALIDGTIVIPGAAETPPAESTPEPEETTTAPTDPSEEAPPETTGVPGETEETTPESTGSTDPSEEVPPETTGVPEETEVPTTAPTDPPETTEGSEESQAPSETEN